jgi:hypothetical protein
MQKIPTLFIRNPEDHRHVLNEITPGCEWVREGHGGPSRKYDGTCVMFDGTAWWARREVKPDKRPPANFRYIQADQVTGKTIGWEPIAQSAFAKYHAEALQAAEDADYPEGCHPGPWPVGTYELIGPKINGNPERCEGHELVAHQYAEVVYMPHRSFEDIREVVLRLARESHWEGLVFHDGNGRMAKIKARDFPS